MRKSTLSFLACPNRAHSDPFPLRIDRITRIEALSDKKDEEIIDGTLFCNECKKKSWIVSGVAILVEDPQEYFYAHAQGIKNHIHPESLPPFLAEPFNDGVEELKSAPDEHFSESLESDRINSLYFATHYLDSQTVGKGSPSAAQELIQKFWNSGPFSVAEKWISQHGHGGIVELGCGTGGLVSRLHSQNLKSYLGVDLSFASVSMARNIWLQPTTQRSHSIPSDLFLGPQAQTVKLGEKLKNTSISASIDFIVSDIETTPLLPHSFDMAVSLNTIDMMNDPILFVKNLTRLLKPQGLFLHSSPYIWHPLTAKKLKKAFSKCHSSNEMIRELFKQNRLALVAEKDPVPWLFFKHDRQLELYFADMILSQLL